jgi:hypothetical protein
MKYILSFFTLFFLMIVIGCRSSYISGVYVCDQSQKKADTIIHQGSRDDIYLDVTCAMEELDFKRDKTVEIKLENGSFLTSYLVNKDDIIIKGTGSDILMKIKDKKTLSGEGIFKGFYRKK